MDWFRTMARDLIAGLITTGFLETLTKINYKFSLFLGLMFGTVDYIIYLWKGWNLVNWFIDSS